MKIFGGLKMPAAPSGDPSRIPFLFFAGMSLLSLLYFLLVLLFG